MSMPMVVLLPAPLWPSSAVTWRSYTSRSSASTASVGPRTVAKLRDSASVLITTCPGGMHVTERPLCDDVGESEARRGVPRSSAPIDARGMLLTSAQGPNHSGETGAPLC